MEKTARWYVRIYFKFISLQGDIFSQNKLVPLQIWVISFLIVSGTSIRLFWRMYRKGTRDKMWSVLRAYDSGKLKTRKNLISETYYTQMIMTVILTTISDLKKNFYFMNTDKKNVMRVLHYTYINTSFTTGYWPTTVIHLDTKREFWRNS